MIVAKAFSYNCAVVFWVECLRKQRCVSRIPKHLCLHLEHLCCDHKWVVWFRFKHAFNSSHEKLMNKGERVDMKWCKMMENFVIFSFFFFLSDHVIITYHTGSAQIISGRKLYFLMQITLLVILSYSDAFPHNKNDCSMRVCACNIWGCEHKMHDVQEHLLVYDCLFTYWVLWLFGWITWSLTGSNI